MSAMGHKRTFAAQNGMSAIPPKTDMAWAEMLRPLSANSGQRQREPVSAPIAKTSCRELQVVPSAAPGHKP
jgi:hypothetical protein